MASVADNLALIKRKALAYALANGGNEYDGAAFGDVLGSIAWVESGLGQQPVGDNGTSFALFHTNINGRNLSGIGQRAATPQQLAAILADPNVDIDNSMPELWDHFQRHGGVAKFTKDPAFFTAQVALTGQRPQREAWETVTNSGGYRDGVAIAQGKATAPQRGSPLQAAAGLASNGAAPVTQIQVNRTPVQGGITSRFGTPFPMDSGATYNGQQYPHFNKGVDYGATGGSPVTAVVGGTVRLAADDGSGWGPRVVIVDQEGFEHSYGHLDAASIAQLRPGQQVQSRQQIGVVAGGQAGTSTGPHLSYDIFKNGEPVDPSPWLGVDVREPGIPASSQVPSYLGSQGGAGMAQTAGGTGFFDKEISEAQWHLTWAQQRMTDIRNGKYGDPASAENQKAMSELQARIEEETARLTSAQAGLRTQQLTNPAAAGADPVQQASAVAGIRAQQNEHNRWIFDTFTGLIDKTFQNQLGVANVMTDILKANEANIQAAVASRVRKGELNSADAASVVQAESMKQAAEAARFGQAMTLAGMINENDWKIAERQLPEGQNFVPQLGPDDPLAQVLGRLNIQFPGIAVRQTDFSQLDMRKSLADAQGLTPAVGEFSIDALRQVAKENKDLPVYNPTLLSASSVNLPGPPNLASEDILARIPGASQAGGLDDEDLINRILQRGPYAPQPSVTSGASGGSAAPAGTPTTATAPLVQPNAPRNADPGQGPALTDASGNPAGATGGPIRQVTTVQPRVPTAQSAAQQGQSGRFGLGAIPSLSGFPGADLLQQGNGGVDDDIVDLLKRLGFGAVHQAREQVGNVVSGLKSPRKWLR